MEQGLQPYRGREIAESDIVEGTWKDVTPERTSPSIKNRLIGLGICAAGIMVLASNVPYYNMVTESGATGDMPLTIALRVAFGLGAIALGRRVFKSRNNAYWSKIIPS